MKKYIFFMMLAGLIAIGCSNSGDKTNEKGSDKSAGDKTNEKTSDKSAGDKTNEKTSDKSAESNSQNQAEAWAPKEWCGTKIPEISQKKLADIKKFMQTRKVFSIVDIFAFAGSPPGFWGSGMVRTGYRIEGGGALYVPSLFLGQEVPKIDYICADFGSRAEMYCYLPGAGEKVVLPQVAFFKLKELYYYDRNPGIVHACDLSGKFVAPRNVGKKNFVYRYDFPDGNYALIQLRDSEKPFWKLVRSNWLGDTFDTEKSEIESVRVFDKTGKLIETCGKFPALTSKQTLKKLPAGGPPLTQKQVYDCCAYLRYNPADSHRFTNKYRTIATIAGYKVPMLKESDSLKSYSYSIEDGGTLKLCLENCSCDPRWRIYKYEVYDVYGNLKLAGPGGLFREDPKLELDLFQAK